MGYSPFHQVEVWCNVETDEMGMEPGKVLLEERLKGLVVSCHLKTKHTQVKLGDFVGWSY